LTRDLNNRRVASNRKYREALEALEASTTTAIERAEQEGAEAIERARTISENRRRRVEQIRSGGIRDAVDQARRTRERMLGDLQMKHLQATRQLPVDFKASDNAYKEAAATLEDQRTGIVAADQQVRKSFAGYSAFTDLLTIAPEEASEQPAPTQSARDLLEHLIAKLRETSERLAVFRQHPLPRFFGVLPLALVIGIALLGGVALAFALGRNATAWAIGGGSAVALSVIAWFMHRTGFNQSRSDAEKLAATLTEAKRTHDQCSAAQRLEYEADRQRIQNEFDVNISDINTRWAQAEDLEADFATAGQEKLKQRIPAILERNAKLLVPRLRRLEMQRAARIEQIKTDTDSSKRQLAEQNRSELAALAEEETKRWTELETEWKNEVAPLYAAMDTTAKTLSARFPIWDAPAVDRWKPAKDFSSLAKLAQLELDLAKTTNALPKDPRLALPGPSQVSVPLALAFPEQGSLLFETNDSGDPTVIGTLNRIIVGLLAASPPGKLRFTIIDPVGLGQNFAGLMHLTDYEDALINRRIWTQRDHIEDRLAELNEHIEKVIQMYLRNEFATITEYNEQAGSVAEKYHFVVVADFPANFSETAAKRLQSIAQSGPRCGVFTLIHWDRRQPMPDGFVPDELRKNSVCIQRRQEGFALTDDPFRTGATLVFDPPIDPEVEAKLIHKIGQSSVESNRVEVPFAEISPKAEERWTNETTNELKIAIGRTGATKLQYLAIGKGTRQHALFAGKTGSGKSTLFHVIITNLALSCPPDQVEFYLIDFKKGVEFKCYATKRLPHARVVAIESDREFALSVLQRVDDELKRRGDLFRKLGVQDIAGYKKAGGTEPIPRSLLIIDEFQEFFVEDDQVAQTASLLFDRIVRQGRAFGIHVLLGSQTLGGAYTLARATLGQMVIRVALQCNEADAYLIMDENNAAPRLLSRPGEGIYNDAAGAIEGNSPFQVVWLGDEERDHLLDQVSALATQRPERQPSPIVFEGNAPADLQDNDLLRDSLAAIPVRPPAAARCWLGAPNSIKGPTEAAFHRQSGNHLLIVGQRDESVLAMTGISLISLAAQYPLGAAKFILIHSASPGSSDAESIERIAAMIPHGVKVSRGVDLAEVMNGLAEELKNRSASAEATATAPPVFIFIHGLHRFKKLRHEDDFSFSMSDDAPSNPGAQLNDLITEGSSHGLHLIVSIDTFNNVNRCLSRKALAEFEMRVVFQMSANDSASLIDSPQASNLGLHRALLYNEHEGTLETFRPYAMPDSGWIEKTASALRERAASASHRST
jgi:hypothetical protein